ncbi:hypothetical protein L1887_17954 [Cichorium endivia]|nr:hypothetical protein L1887_17954 [Cichorium endivia]
MPKYVEVVGNDTLIISSIVIVTCLGGEASVVATVLDAEEVTRLHRSDEFGECLTDVTACRLGIRVVCIDKDFDIVLGESLMINQTTVHSLYVIDASPELRLGTLSKPFCLKHKPSATSPFFD